MISVVIPTLNAEGTLTGTLAALVPAAVDGLVREVIVVDGGSRDRTAQIVDSAGAELMRCDGGRGPATGGRRAAGALSLAAVPACRHGAGAGLGARGRRPSWSAWTSGGVRPPRRPSASPWTTSGLSRALLERLVALRCAVFRLPYGDQGLLIPKRLYDEVGGYRPLPLMEDVDLVRRLGRRRTAHAACARRDQRGSLPPRRLLAPVRPQSALPDALHAARADARHQPHLRVVAARMHQLSVRRDGCRGACRLTVVDCGRLHTKRGVAIMQSISRRGFVISAAAAGAAFGLDGPLEFIGAGLRAEGAGKDVVKFKVGDIEVIQMYDGVWEKAHDEKFIKNASLDDTKAALKAAGLTDAHVPITFTVTADQVQGQARAVRLRHRCAAGADRRPHHQERPVEAGRHRSGQGDDHRHHPFPRRSHHRPDGQGHQRADLPERARSIVPAAEYKYWTDTGGHGGRGQAHPGGVPGLEEHQAVRGRQGGRCRACAPSARPAIRRATPATRWLRQASS